MTLQAVQAIAWNLFNRIKHGATLPADSNRKVFFIIELNAISVFSETPIVDLNCCVWVIVITGNLSAHTTVEVKFYDDVFGCDEYC
jgi:hypothetical protein